VFFVAPHTVANSPKAYTDLSSYRRAVEDASPYDEDEADARLHGKRERFLISNSEFRISNCEFSLAIPAGFEYNSTG